MVLGQILKVGQIVFKYRKAIYSVVTAQDRYIKSAFVGTRVSKSAQYGWRSGAAAGGLLGSFIKNDEITPGNGSVLPPKQRPQITSGKSYKTRSRYSRRASAKYCRNKYTGRYN